MTQESQNPLLALRVLVETFCCHGFADLKFSPAEFDSFQVDFELVGEVHCEGSGEADKSSGVHQ